MITRKATVLGLLFLLCVLAAAQNSDSTIKVDVKLVNVFVTVTDEHGAPVAGLKKENFALREDGHDEKISVFDKESALPLSIVLALDTSLSTRKDLPLEMASARRFAHSILRPVDAISLYQFSEIVNELTPFTSDLKEIDRGIDRMRLGSATALYDALFLGSQALGPRQGRKVMVVITDGGDTASKVDLQRSGAGRAGGRGDSVQHHRGADCGQRRARHWRRTRAHPALRRYRRQIFLRNFRAPVG